MHRDVFEQWGVVGLKLRRLASGRVTLGPYPGRHMYTVRLTNLGL